MNIKESIEAALLRREGLTFEQIGKLYGLHRANAHHRVSTGEKLIQDIQSLIDSQRHPSQRRKDAVPDMQKESFVEFITGKTTAELQNSAMVARERGLTVAAENSAVDPYIGDLERQGRALRGQTRDDADSGEGRIAALIEELRSELAKRSSS